VNNVIYSYNRVTVEAIKTVNFASMVIVKSNNIKLTSRV